MITAIFLRNRDLGSGDVHRQYRRGTVSVSLRVRNIRAIARKGVYDATSLRENSVFLLAPAATFRLTPDLQQPKLSVRGGDPRPSFRNRLHSDTTVLQYDVHTFPHYNRTIMKLGLHTARLGP